MRDISRPHDMTGLTPGELEQATCDLRTSLALTRPNSAVRVPILARMTAAGAELAERGRQGGSVLAEVAPI